jgi:hypothetical protein
MATGAVREFAVHQHGIQKIAALQDFCQQRIVLRCDWIDRFLGIQRMDGASSAGPETGFEERSPRSRLLARNNFQTFRIHAIEEIP